MNLIAEGNTAEVYSYKDDKVCKLFYPGYSKEAIKLEYNNSQVIQNNKINIPIPRCYEIIKNENRMGIIYEKVKGKTALQLFFENKDVDFLVNTLVYVHKSILKYHTVDLLAYKDFLMFCAGNNNELIMKINRLPDGDFICHGDLHPANIMIDNLGKIFVIDLMNMCCGPWQYDVARTYFLISKGSVDKEAHNKKEITKAKKYLADLYIEKMGIKYDDISDFIDIIQICRKGERNLIGER